MILVEFVGGGGGVKIERIKINGGMALKMFSITKHTQTRESVVRKI